LWLEVNNSSYLLIFIVGVHLLAILSCLMIAPVFLLKYLLLICVAASLYIHMRRYRQGLYLLTLKYTQAFAWEWLEGETFSAIRILNSSVLNSFVCVLHVQRQSGSRSLLIFRDAVSAESYRKLRVALKINAVQPNKQM